jgi:autotransporter-associated beta strand protein
VSGGTLSVGGGGTSGSITGAASVASGATLAFNRSNDSTYAGNLSGTGAVTKTGAGTLTMTGESQGFTGTVTVNGGTILLDQNADLNATSVVVNGGASFVFGENGDVNFPNTTVVTINGGTFDLKQGEVFGGVVLHSGTFSMSSSTRTGVSPTAQPANGYILESGTVTTNFSGPANGGLLAGTTFTDKTTAGTVVIGPGVTFGEANTINIKEGVLEMTTASVPTTASATVTTVTVGDASTTGTLRVTDAGAGSSARTWAIGSGGGVFDIVHPAGSVTLAADLSGSGTLTKTGAGTLVIASPATFNGPAVVNGGTLAVSGSLASASGITVNATGTFEARSSQTVKGITVNTGGVARVASGGAAKVLTVGDGTATYVDAAGSHLNLAGGKLDLTTNGLIADYAAGSDATAFAAIRSKIISGYNASSPGAQDGNWLGATGITSSTAAADANAKGVGYALASDVLGAGGGSFMGSTADGSAVLARYTLLGDATLNGVVDFNDLVQLAQNYNVVDGSRTWFTGDFTYDGKTDFNDLVKLAQNYNTALPTEPIPGVPADFGADLAAAFASVPEPGSVALLGLAAFGLLPRRRGHN